MESDKENKNVKSLFSNIYNLNAIKRSVIIWIGFQVILWSVFSISYLMNKEAWTNVVEVEAITAAVGGGWWSTFLFIVFNNLFICFLIALGNLFVRFGFITPGLIVLVIQAITIGWLAGTNGFELPFESVKAANLQFIKIGLWETTAYALLCAITLPKSLLVANTFPAKKWSLTRKLKDIRLSFAEKIILTFSLVVLIIAGIVETFSIIG